MDSLSSILSSTEQKLNRASEQPRILPRSEWEEQLDNFLERLNPGRVKKGYAPYTHGWLAKRLQQCGHDTGAKAYQLYRKCESGRNFGALFETFTRKKV